MDKVNVSVQLDDGPDGTLVLTCPKCRKVTKKSLRSVTGGIEIACPCGQFTTELSGDDVRSVRRNVDRLRAALKDFEE